MSVKDELIKNKLPQHVAIIMDGNGRWAKKKGNSRMFGHKHGVKAVKRVIEAGAELELGYITVYAFSTENWNRPKLEVDALMALLVSTISAETETLVKNNVRLKVIGGVDNMPKKVQKKLQECIENTDHCTGLTLNLALNYSSRWEITEAVKSIAQSVKSNDLNIDEIDANLFSSRLTTGGIPDPELMIRTSGELRLSNFLMWQLAYAELYFCDVLWPDFTKENFYEALFDYQSRERRFGKTSEQL
ncbi:isoprenyl transferase [Saccharicrinis aurantiacus]|uniref:isoprenyl transferase n=1 Tax=Saccharicrinis aurantiacus TaxID=1849719 RepID=UPI0024911C96|nr:isoprenyl transferase [Saccharicrinis aurantiacus]